MEERTKGVRNLIAFTVVYALNFIGYLGLKRGLPFWYLSQSKPSWAIPYMVFAIVPIALCLPIAWAVIKVLDLEVKKPAFLLVPIQLIGWGIWEWSLFAFHSLVFTLVGAGIGIIASILLATSYWKRFRSAAVAFQAGLIWSIYGGLLAIALSHINNH